jgi:hypothetical protein
MSNHDDDRPEDNGAYQPDSGRSEGQRRKQIAIGAAGLAVVLGAGGYFITAEVSDGRSSTTTQDTGALAPIAPAESTAPSASAEPSVAAARPAPAGNKGKPAPSPSHSRSVGEQIKEAQEKAAKDGYPVQHALTAEPGAKTGPVSERSESRKDGVLRIITAKHDLTGQRELLWPAHGGEPVGDAECTQTFQFANDAKPSTKPSLLLCWHTSATRSVVTVLVDRAGKPSSAESVKVIDQEWAKLG